MLASSVVSSARSTRLEPRLGPAGLEPGEVEQRVDQLQQPPAVALDQLEPRALGRRAAGDVGVGERVLDRAEQQGQRRAELVADVGEERRLGPVELGQLLGALPLGLVGAGAADAGRELAGDQVEEAAVAVVERPVAVEPDDEGSRTAAVRPGCRSGSSSACGRRLGPGPGRQRRRTGRPGRRPGRPRPGRALRRSARAGCGRQGRAAAGAAAWPGSMPLGAAPARAVPVVVEQVGRGEGQSSAGRPRAAAPRQPRTPRPRSATTSGLGARGRAASPSPLADDPLGVLADHAQHAGDAGRRRRSAGCRRRCGRSPRRSRCARGTAAAPRPRSPRRCSARGRCAARCRPRSRPTPRRPACPAPTGTSRRACRAGRRRCRRTSARAPRPPHREARPAARYG